MPDSKYVFNSTDSNFQDDVLNHSSSPVIVDFWAEWCGPCKAMAPVLDELAQEYEGKIKVVKINVDENPKIPQKYGVRGLPSLFAFKNGELISQMLGNQARENIRNKFEEILS